jgi:amphiphysin
MEELKSAVAPELELIQSRVMGPVKEFQGVMKLIRKSITKRDHKVRTFLLICVPIAQEFVSAHRL